VLRRVSIDVKGTLAGAVPVDEHQHPHVWRGQLGRAIPWWMMVSAAAVGSPMPTPMQAGRDARRGRQDLT
jgi:hypothetical protein